jgi:UDP-N-acetylglucosamine/UDP-N-acetylgalactosamine diphosphorylase
MKQQELIAKARQANQGHIFKFWNELSESQRHKFLEQLQNIDFDLLKQWADKYIFSTYKPSFKGQHEPADTIIIPKTIEQIKFADYARQVGEQLLFEGKVAAILVAGGQGTRLGCEGPKGKFKIGPISNKSLFQIYAEKIKALGLKYGKPIIWFIMTSDINDEETRAFFNEHNYFGLNPEQVFFFVQGMIPALDESGKLILDAKDHIFTNPNGHGGMLYALRDSGVLELMKQQGVEQLFYFQVDNVLIKICNPYFIGYHALSGANMSAKIVAKRNPHEKVGVIAKINGEISVIEYSDLSKEDMEAQNPDGNLKYHAGSIAIHMFRRDFIEQLTTENFSLPFHVAHKKIPYLNEQGQLIEPQSPNGYKFEMFIFDALPFAHKVKIMEVRREDEFSPIKNATGSDSPATAKRDLMNYHARLLQRCGVAVPFDDQKNVIGSVEISPLFALDEEELKIKIDHTFQFQDGLYLE